MDIRGDGKNSLDLVSFLRNFQKDFKALRKTIEKKNLRISSLGASLEKLGKSNQREVKDLKYDIVDLKERLSDT